MTQSYSDVVCPTCNAQPGDFCKTKAGKRTHGVHNTRKHVSMTQTPVEVAERPVQPTKSAKPKKAPKKVSKPVEEIAPVETPKAVEEPVDVSEANVFEVHFDADTNTVDVLQSAIDKVASEIPCPTCLAIAEEPCENLNRVTMARFHRERLQPLLDIFSAGVAEGFNIDSYLSGYADAKALMTKLNA